MISFLYVVVAVMVLFVIVICLAVFELEKRINNLEPK